jgi:N4-gp56 family major capsid protein
MQREIRRVFPAYFNVGQKSNRLPVLNSAAARLGQALRETQDILQRDNLEATASVINCVGGLNTDLPTELAVTDVDDVVALLQGNDGEYITNIVPAEDKIGTSPIGDSYGAMVHTRMIPVLNSLVGFNRKFNYPNIDKTLSSEWGGVNNVRFFVSSQGSISPNSSLLGNDVANCFITAKEGYKVVWQAGGKAKFIYLPPGYNNDPCMLRHTAGCSFYQGQCITNDLWVQNLRSTGLAP